MSSGAEAASVQMVIVVVSMLDGLVAAGAAVEATGWSKRRLFGLKGMGSLADSVRPHYRPERGRGCGQAPVVAVEEQDVGAGPAVPLPSLAPIERRTFSPD
jgi:hypothetical protein